MFNTERQKLFFFVSVEKNPSLEPQSITRLTMPTALERTGNFSESRDQNGNLFRIKDPLQPWDVLREQHHSTKSDQQERTGANEYIDPAERSRYRRHSRVYNFEFQDTRKARGTSSFTGSTTKRPTRTRYSSAPPTSTRRATATISPTGTMSGSTRFSSTSMRRSVTHAS